MAVTEPRETQPVSRPPTAWQWPRVAVVGGGGWWLAWPSCSPPPSWCSPCWPARTSRSVEERYLNFTHWVAVPLGFPLLFLFPEDPGQVPAKDLTCLTKH